MLEKTWRDAFESWWIGEPFDTHTHDLVFCKRLAYRAYSAGRDCGRAETQAASKTPKIHCGETLQTTVNPAVAEAVLDEECPHITLNLPSYCGHFFLHCRTCEQAELYAENARRWLTAHLRAAGVEVADE